MKLALLVLVALFCTLSLGEQLTAQCKLTATSSFGSPLDVAGWVTFTFNPFFNEVVVTANITGSLTSGNDYGMHVHEFGDLTDAAGGTGAGGHYVGGGSATHGCPPSPTRHEGDMGNWTASATGIQQTKTLDLLELNGINSIIGRAVILHELFDNCTGANGFAGNRLAQCVIGITNQDGNVAQNDLSPVDSAVCVLQATPNCPNCSGTVWLTQVSQTNGSIEIPIAVEVIASVSGLQLNSVHGFHIHQYGDLSSADATSAGGHWNPFGRNHALPPTSPRHTGDLGNLQSYASDGLAWYKYQTTALTDLNTVIGRAVVVHQQLDHGTGLGCDATGSAGSRYAICVIGIANTATEPPAVPITVNTTWANEDCTTPTPSSTATSEGDGNDGGDGDGDGDDDDGGLIAGVVIGWIFVCVLLIVVAVLGFFLWRAIQAGNKHPKSFWHKV